MSNQGRSLIWLLLAIMTLTNARFVDEVTSREVAVFTEADQQLVIEDLLGKEDETGRTTLGKFFLSVRMEGKF